MLNELFIIFSYQVLYFSFNTESQQKFYVFHVICYLLFVPDVQIKWSIDTHSDYTYISSSVGDFTQSFLAHGFVQVWVSVFLKILLFSFLFLILWLVFPSFFNNNQMRVLFSLLFFLGLLIFWTVGFHSFIHSFFIFFVA